MSFFTDSSRYTHVGSFYCIPVYLNLDGEVPVIEGTNRLYDWLFDKAADAHNLLLENPSVMLSSVWSLEYQGSFEFKITGELVGAGSAGQLSQT